MRTRATYAVLMLLINLYVFIMRFASLLVSALVALVALAAPLPTDKETGVAGKVTHPAVISHQSSDSARGVSGAQLQGRVLKPKLTVPTVAQMKQYLNVAPSKLLYYSGPGGYEQKARQKAASMGLKILDDAWKDPSFPRQHQAALDAASMKKFWDNASEAIAEMSSGTIYVLLPANTVGTNFHPGTVWSRLEWPELQRNSKVTKVIKVNPDNSKQEVIKGAGAGSRSRSPSPKGRGKARRDFEDDILYV
ncbi:hypothetical protein LshimejAT787_0310880 [Lyophyllum shimeji]|uniref:Uncharacterized protein n=1 Tax=Lyophyllum shimeji TaxID=47721 RepID=A0A9P3PJA7_LYOSH|nr:hypothetical protein LshimejAT787_0310880 [Lyophyllum shimeji]